MEMASYRVCRSSSLKLTHDCVNEEEEDSGFVRYTHGLGKKRIEISKDCDTKVPSLKRQCSERMVMMMMLDEFCHEKSDLESLPQDVLIRIICGVNHADLKQLHYVSKSIREATEIAKQMHFAYSTPTKVKAFRTSIHFDESNDLIEIEAPNAPKQWRSHRSINKKKLAHISVALFA